MSGCAANCASVTPSSGNMDALCAQTATSRTARTSRCTSDGGSVTGVVTTAKSAVVSRSAATACGVEKLLMRRCTPG